MVEGPSRSWRPRRSPTTGRTSTSTSSRAWTPGSSRTIRPRLVASFLRHLADKGLSPGTIRKIRTVLSSVMSYAVADGVRRVEPGDEGPAADPRTRPAGSRRPSRKRLASSSPPNSPTRSSSRSCGSQPRRAADEARRWRSAGATSTSTARASPSDQWSPPASTACRSVIRTKTKKPRTIAVSSITFERLAAHRAWHGDRDVGRRRAAGDGGLGRLRVQRRIRQSARSPFDSRSLAARLDDSPLPAGQGSWQECRPDRPARPPPHDGHRAPASRSRSAHGDGPSRALVRGDDDGCLRQGPTARRCGSGRPLGRAARSDDRPDSSRAW